MSVLRTKTIEQSIADTEEPEHRLKKDLGALDLVVFGVGVTIGAGIFVLTGQAAGGYAGPAITISFLIAGVACALAALCYAELASIVPVAGSAYTFSFATLGEIVAWTIGWDLILEFTLGAAALATGFSGYLQSLLAGTPFEVPAALASAEDGILNLPAALLIIGLTAIVSTGIKLASRVNEIVVAIKVSVVLLVIVVGLFFVDAANWSPFVPPSAGVAPAEGGFGEVPLVQSLLGIEPSVYGFAGVVSAAALVFFAFIGFDVVATTAEEARNPQRDMPIGILGSLAIVTVLYMAVSLIVTGVRPYTEIDPDDAAPLATAFNAVGVEWMGNIVAVGATIGLTVISMILLIGQTRVAFAMARDGLFPAALAKVHPTFGTPYRLTLITGAVVTVIASLVPLSTLAELINIGTLFAFIVVSLGVIVLRRKRPDLPRRFRVPLVPIVPGLAVVLCLYLMLYLTGDTWIRFLIWMGLGYVVYFVYGRRHSALARGGRHAGPLPEEQRTTDVGLGGAGIPPRRDRDEP